MVGKDRYTKEEIKNIQEDKEEIENSKKWLSISKEDIESSEILFKNKKYPSSVMNFQQSVEKTTKALALIEKALKSFELKKTIGHNPLEKYYGKGISDNLEKAQNLEKAFEKVPELKEIPVMKDLKLDEYKDNLELAKKIVDLVTKQGLIFSDDLVSLDAIIEDAEMRIKEMEKSKDKKFRKKDYDLVERGWKENMGSYVALIEKKGIKSVSEEEKKQAMSASREMIEHLARRLYKSIILQAITNALNAVLNLIMTPHFEFSRYPDKKNPLEYYTEKNPLIIRFNRLINIQRKNISYHEEYWDFIKGLAPEIVMEKQK